MDPGQVHGRDSEGAVLGAGLGLLRGPVPALGGVGRRREGLQVEAGAVPARGGAAAAALVRARGPGQPARPDCKVKRKERVLVRFCQAKDVEQDN